MSSNAPKSSPEPWKYDPEERSIYDAEGKLVASQVSAKDALKLRLRFVDRKEG